MKTQVPLYRIEAVRSRLDDLFDPPPTYDELFVSGPIATDYRSDPDYQTLRDLLDDVIEERRP